MRNSNRGFTIFELIVALGALGSLCVTLWLIYWIGRALMKYVGA